MSETQRRRRGMIRISMHSIIKALYGNVEYEAVSMRVSKEDKTMLDLTIAHPDLPEWKPGSKLQRIDIKRKYQQDEL